jgi:hypothetical protein
MVIQGQKSTQLTNAPLMFDGGQGSNALIVLGTPSDNNIMVDPYAVYGMGQYIRFLRMSSITINGMAGDDKIYVHGTNRHTKYSIWVGGSRVILRVIVIALRYVCVLV